MEKNRDLRKIVMSVLNLYGAIDKDRLLSVVNYYVEEFTTLDELNEVIEELLEFREKEIFVFNENLLANFLFYYEDDEEFLEVKQKVERIVLSHLFSKQYLPELEELLAYEDPAYTSNKDVLEEFAEFIIDNEISPFSDEDTILVIFNIAFTFKEGINVSVLDLIEEEGFIFLTKELEEEAHRLLGLIKETSRMYILFGGTVSEHGQEFADNIEKIIEEKLSNI